MLSTISRMLLWQDIFQCSGMRASVDICSRIHGYISESISNREIAFVFKMNEVEKA